MVDEQNPDGPPIPGTTGAPAAGPEGSGPAAPPGPAASAKGAGSPPPVDTGPTAALPTDPARTVASGADAATTVGVPGTAGATAASPRWSARAGVRPAGMGTPAGTGGPPGWDEPVADDPYDGRSWLTPVIVTIVALALLAVLGTGLVLIYRELSGGTGGASPGGQVSTAAPAPTPERTTAAPTAANETTPAPSATPSSAAPTQVQIPPLSGVPESVASTTLDALGLRVVVQRQESRTVLPGTVIRTDPAAGSVVNVGSTVTLIVAKAPSPAPTRSLTSAPSQGAHLQTARVS